MIATRSNTTINHPLGVPHPWGLSVLRYLGGREECRWNRAEKQHRNGREQHPSTAVVPLHHDPVRDQLPLLGELWSPTQLPTLPVRLLEVSSH